MQKTEDKLSPEDEKLKKQHEKAKKKAEKKVLYLKKMKSANTFQKILLFFRHKTVDLVIYMTFFMFIFGIVGGVVSRSIWEIWKMIYGLHL